MFQLHCSIVRYEVKLTLLVSHSLKFCMIGFKILERVPATEQLLVDLLLELIMKNP